MSETLIRVGLCIALLGITICVTGTIIYLWNYK